MVWGLLVVAELMQRLGRVELANCLMPRPGSNRWLRARSLVADLYADVA